MNFRFALLIGIVLSAVAHAEPPCKSTGDSAPLGSATGASAIQAVIETTQAGGVKPAVGVGLSVGSFSGVQASVNLFKDSSVDVVFEGFAGLALLAPAYGGGVRLELRPVRGVSNQLLVSPGVDVYYVPTIGNWFFSPYSPEAIVVPSVDVKWLHQFSEHLALELGVRAGYGLTFGSPSPGGPFGKPTVQLLSGLRF